MPEMTFTVRWPDGTVESCYSPSLVMHDHLVAGDRYPVRDFVSRTSDALDAASARVREKFGFECTSAAAQKSRIETASGRFEPLEFVDVLDMQPPLPVTQDAGSAS